MTRLDQLQNLRDQIDAEIASERARVRRIALLKAAADAEMTRGTIATRVTVTVARHYGIDLDYLLGRSRKSNITEARAVAAYMLHKAGETYSAIAREFERDHTTIIHAVRRVEREPDLLMTANYIASLLDPEAVA